MKTTTWPFGSHLVGGGQKRRSIDQRLFELRKAWEDVAEGMRAGCLPDQIAAMLISRIENRDSFGLSMLVDHVR